MFRSLSLMSIIIFSLMEVDFLVLMVEIKRKVQPVM